MLTEKGGGPPPGCHDGRGPPGPTPPLLRPLDARPAAREHGGRRHRLRRLRVLRGNHLSNTTCLTHVFFKSGK